jgi:DNA-binding protein HU-beta
MTKSEIVKEIPVKTGIDSKAVLAVVEGFMNEVNNI